ncbi:Hypothetical Protein FCC1311_010142 [Hondaea fermentalgiana]|uniref:Uncharacterized protein n=1 Tax=Hondaea fermentalgiana TaxID=2315210 RepID=A0A2R5G194_9STRA|nr:Hypothetical Protein FCC1311_010142 [Hondaea fermentalgiana]|eukprot:GBG24796.1 Hypothetical Protein FCC1311_010142 [Hondaea fermentalgiana]
MGDGDVPRERPLRAALHLARHLASPWWILQFVKSPISYPRRLVVFILFLWGLGRLRSHDPTVRLTERNKVVIYLPRLLCDVLARLAWPLNMLLDVAPLAAQMYFARKPGVWPMPVKDLESMQTSGDASKARESILSEKVSVVPEETLTQLFGTLEPAHAEDLVAKTWEGKLIRTGTRALDLVDLVLARPLLVLGVGWGKRFRAPHRGDALILHWMDKIYFPMPMYGNASIVDMEYAGKTQATARYNHQPWNEHFRILNDGKESGKMVLLGAWCTRDTIGGWFTLTHQTEVETLSASNA